MGWHLSFPSLQDHYTVGDIAASRLEKFRGHRAKRGRRAGLHRSALPTRRRRSRLRRIVSRMRGKN